MASLFSRQFSVAARPGLLGLHGEAGVYLPRNGAERRPMRAIVERGTLEIIAEIGDQATQAIIVQVANDARTGILASEIDTGGDKFRVALREGEDPTDRPIVKLISDSGGFTRFAVQ